MIVKVIYEGGLTILRDDKVWEYSIVGSRPPRESADQFIKSTNLRPILVTDKAPDNSLATHLLDPAMTIFLDQIQYHSETAFVPEKPDLVFHGYHIGHVIGAVAHHCRQLAFQYSKHLTRFVRAEQGIPIKEAWCDYRDASRVYYEFEALVTSARRSYDSLRHLLWKSFESGSAPSSLKKVLTTASHIPPDLRAEIEESWKRYGEKVTAYRDCIQHYVPVCHALPFMRMTRNDADMWVASAWIPDNPECRSQAKFLFHDKLDALASAWGIASEVSRIVVDVIEGVANEKR